MCGGIARSGRAARGGDCIASARRRVSGRALRVCAHEYARHTQRASHMNYVMAKIDAHYLFDEFLLMENIYSAGLPVPHFPLCALSLARPFLYSFAYIYTILSNAVFSFSVYSIHFVSISISAITSTQYRSTIRRTQSRQECNLFNANADPRAIAL